MAISKINDCFELLAMVTYADKLKVLSKKNSQLALRNRSFNLY